MEKDMFDFIINEEDEVMLLLYARDTEPKEAILEINVEEMSAVLYRNEEDAILIEPIPEDVFDSLQDADVLMVCELSDAEDGEDDDDANIVYAYEADITF